MENLKVLISQRAQLKSRLTRLKNYFNQTSNKDNIDDNDITELRDRFENNKTLLKEYEVLHNKIIENSSDESHDLDLETFENGFYDLNARIKVFLDKKEIGINKVPKSESDMGDNFLRLPSIELPSFSGEFENWPEFHDAFDSLIHSNSKLSNIQKFYYLISALKGEAAQSIKSLKVSSENYLVAWELLKKRFENKRLIVQNNIKALFNLEPIQKDSYNFLQRFLDNVLKITQSLKNYNQPTADALLIYILTAKFGATNTRFEWETFKPAGEFPTLKELLEFLEKRCQFLGSLEANKCGQNLINSNSSQNKMYGKGSHHKNTNVHLSTFKSNCILCKGSHTIYNCESFLKLNTNERISEARRLQLCLNCLKKNHITRECKMQPCKRCGKKHNTLLHIESAPMSEPSTSGVKNITNANHTENNIDSLNKAEPVTRPSHELTLSNHSSNNSQILLSTANIKVYDIHGNVFFCRALLDPGSQSNFITSELCNRLGLPKIKSNLIISGISQSVSNASFKTTISFSSRINNYQREIPCLILDEITANLPTVSFNLAILNIPQNIRLADPKCNVSGRIDILLGANIFWELLCIGQHSLGKDKPILQNTKLGWVLGGTFNENNTPLKKSLAYISAVTEGALDKQLEKFWELEECDNKYNKYSEDERFCEQHFSETTRRLNTGRFVVNIPFKENVIELGESREYALKRLYSLERRLNKNIQLKKDYVKFLEEYENLGHMTKISEKSVTVPHYYLPHHAVFKETSTTTKLRVVFDGSAKTSSGISLNETQYVGPTIQNDLFSILLRFRKYGYVISADIGKMYRQILIEDSQRQLQLILWRPATDQPINCYKLNTVTYGTSAASFLAVRCLKQLAIENKDKFERAAMIIENDFYVDDLLTGSDSLEEIIKIQSDVSNILSSAGFQLRKWLSNSRDVLQQINLSNNVEEHCYLQFPDGNQSKTLGILWDPFTDSLRYTINDFSRNTAVTKRTILSITAQIFDPLGLLSPIIVKAKLIIQKIWQYKLSWDEAIPLDLNTMWIKLRDQFHVLRDIKIQRHVLAINYQAIELHGFCDASERAYGACIYVRTIHKLGNIQVTLLCSKSRVAPLKNVTLPRLELCGALLLAQLVSKVEKATNIHFDNKFYWCDSTITLSWIQAPPNKWKTFVANRVAEIQRLTNVDRWRHIKGSENPADLISRGMDPKQIISANLWWNGPSFLSKKVIPTLNQPIIEPNLLEARNISAVATNSDKFSLFSKFSCLNKLKRVTALCLRFIHNSQVKGEKRITDSITTAELETALIAVIRIAQNEAFTAAIQALLQNKPLEPKSQLLQLNPYIDDHKILRVGGRFEQSNFNYCKKHPIILPSHHELTYMIIRNEHLRLLHCGANLLLASLREKYWPISGKNMVKKVIHRCITCFRAKPKFSNPIMGNLPKHRLEPAPPFYNCGVDFAGPVLIKNKKGRGSKLIKSYICIFVCFATKAIHLDLVSDLSTEAFFAALRRFMARRGQPLNIYSDNGTNFIGANSELVELYTFLNDKENQRQIITQVNKNNTTWHFTPPRSPHFGGLWEAGVKSVKFHLRRITHNTNLNFEEYYTLLTQIEAILNSRPLSPLSSDVNDPEPLTPAHFLIGRRITSTPQPDLLDVAENRLSKFQHVQKITQHFWQRWSKEYISELQGRTKWKVNHENLLTPGVLVIMKEENVPPLKWRLARVIQLHPGHDGVTRVVSVRNSNGTIVKRAVSKVCVLPLYD